MPPVHAANLVANSGNTAFWVESIAEPCGIVQDCSNSIANALELLQSCTKPSICTDSHCFLHSCQWKHCESNLIINEWQSTWRWCEDAPDPLRNFLGTICQNDVAIGVCLTSQYHKWMNNHKQQRHSNQSTRARQSIDGSFHWFLCILAPEMHVRNKIIYE